MNNAGFPGAGMGSFFYILLALFMPVAELYRTITIKSSWSRWKVVFKQFIIATGILAGIEVTVLLLAVLLHTQPLTIESNGVNPNTPHLFLAFPFLSSLVFLGGLLIIIRGWGLLNKIRKSRKTRSHIQVADPKVILPLIDRLVELYNTSRDIPMTHNLIVDENRFLDIIDQMRMGVPEEVKKALVMIQALEEVIRILELAHRQAENPLQKEELASEALRRAGQILEQARVESENLRAAADGHARESLLNLAHSMERLLTQASL